MQHAEALIPMRVLEEETASLPLPSNQEAFLSISGKGQPGEFCSSGCPSLCAARSPEELRIMKPQTPK